MRFSLEIIPEKDLFKGRRLEAESQHGLLRQLRALAELFDRLNKPRPVALSEEDVERVFQTKLQQLVNREDVRTQLSALAHHAAVTLYTELLEKFNIGTTPGDDAHTPPRQGPVNLAHNAG